MKIVLSFIMFLTILNLSGQTYNIELKRQLDSLHYKDQALREILEPGITSDKKKIVLSQLGYSEDRFAKDSWGIISHQDSLNLIEVENIIVKFGYPGKTLVGEPTNKTAWLVIQHSNEIEKYFPIIKKAGECQEIPMTLVATMEDRELMYKGEEQIYGSQSSEIEIKNKVTGKAETIQFIWPIREPKNVNDLRKSIGFTTTIEEYSKMLGVDYKVYTIEEIMQGQK
jgi:hypothetical protein